MDPIQILALISGIILLIGGILYFIKRRTVVNSSRAIRKLNELNAVTRSRFSGEYNHTIQILYKCRSKAEFDRKSLYQCMSQYIEQNFSSYKSVYEAVRKDETIYKEYNREFGRITTELEERRNNGFLVPGEQYSIIESSYIKHHKIKAPQFRLDVRKVYTSPKKRNQYRDQGFFYSSTFIYTCEKIFQYEKKRRSISEERKLMTSTLRYEILERDGFRCQICGRSAQDGVILHIDHIKPVSKGGKTDPSNLRVLCAECNLGKGARYTPSTTEQSQ